jgi:formate hydrogenlyase subunit 6/NADH:ubiquinone oxidoreductase subunit I
MVRNLLKGPSTEAFPFAPATAPRRLRGRAEFDRSKCVLCGICRHVCAAGAIQLRPDPEQTGMEFILWHNSCVFCGMCADNCPTKALAMTADWRLAHFGCEKYTFTESGFVPYGACSQCGARIQPRPESIQRSIGARHPDLFALCPKCKRESLARHIKTVPNAQARERQ